MSLSTAVPAHLKPRREKIFGQGRGIPLDRNAKARIMVYARAWSVRNKQPRQHHGPLTRAFMDVLEALLWGFHNSRDGRCFPSYEAIAEKARCSRDTVYEAIKALERADILTWVNRIARARVMIEDLLGKPVPGWRIIRTSNAYVFRDPLPCRQSGERSQATSVEIPKSENPTGTLNPDLFSSFQAIPSAKAITPNQLEKALAKLNIAIKGNAIAIV
jgi:hypothetical protein